MHSEAWCHWIQEVSIINTVLRSLCLSYVTQQVWLVKTSLFCVLDRVTLLSSVHHNDSWFSTLKGDFRSQMWAHICVLYCGTLLRFSIRVNKVCSVSRNLTRNLLKSPLSIKYNYLTNSRFAAYYYLKD